MESRKLKQDISRLYTGHIGSIYHGDICAIDKHIECARLMSKAKRDLPDFDKWIKTKGWSKKKIDALLALVDFNDPH